MDLDDLLSQTVEDVADDALAGAVDELSDDERVPDEAYSGDPFEVAPDLPVVPVSRAPRQPDLGDVDAQGVASRTSLPSAVTARKRKASSSKKTAGTKRRRAARGNASSSSPLATRSSAVRFSKPLTKHFMELLAACKADGLLNPTNTKQWGPVWEKLVSTLSSEYPEYQWSKRVVSNKYSTEKKRYSRFITFLARSGTSYDEESGLVQGSDEAFEAMMRKYPDSGWLRKTPLGDRDVYGDVFWRERASGEEIDPISLSEGTDEEEASTADEGESAATPASRSRHTREDSGDPDLALTSSSMATIPPTIEIPILAARRRARERVEDALLASLEGTTSHFSKSRGADDVTIASKDLQARYGGREGQPGLYSPEIVLSCLEKFIREPLNAVVWNTMQEDMKDVRIEQWAREISGG